MAPSPADDSQPADDATQAYSPPDAQASRVVEVLDRYLESLKAGERPDRAKLLAENPEIANQLEACLAGVEFIHAGSAAGKPEGKRLGDFRILREVGSGGMGAVYEAEQVSLGRHVALKILRFGPVSDAAAIQRFQREAETVARLHHTNIVPIFAVGSEGGVNYYAMQYIVGSSLDRVLAEKGGPIPAQMVAEWGLQAAEALAHAHARGVIHRDVKPSNLLIDEEGRIWLTDFGLAKRLDDVTLSMTGALIGTPRYMSPEQAMAKHQGLDHRTDLYSLGATLYELATNKPVFTGDSAHDVLAKIIVRDPDPPRSHNPSLPRDMETILLKCLAKEPERRYDSARHLADDLRAFVDGRAISARRANLAESMVRWYRRQKKSVALTLIAVAATLSLMLLLVGGAYGWHRSRLATLVLKTDHPPILAQLLDKDDAPAAPAVSAPTLQPLEIPGGDYRLRLTAERRLSETFDISLKRGGGLTRKLDLEDQTLFSDYKLDRSYRLTRFHTTKSDDPAKSEHADEWTDILRLTETGLTCVAAHTQLDRWTVNLAAPMHDRLKEDVLLVWPWNAYVGHSMQGVGRFDSRPYVVPGVESGEWYDFNSDGDSDFLLAFRHQAVIVAINGTNGEPLWVVARGAADKKEGQHEQYQASNGANLQPPLIVADQDGDGVRDVAASFIDSRHFPNRGVQRRVELISGATGLPIWSRELPAEYFALPQGEKIPYEFQWFAGTSGGYSGSGSGDHSSYHYLTRNRGSIIRNGDAHYRPSELRLTNGIEPELQLIAGKHLLVFKVKSGELADRELGIRTEREPQFADFDGDGANDLLLTEIIPPPTSADNLKLSVWSPRKNAVLWTGRFAAEQPHQSRMHIASPPWPIVEDVDGDGAADVLLPDGSTVGTTPTVPWGKVALLDGKTGKRRWSMRVLNADQQVEFFLPGPDVNADGCRDVFVATLWSRKMDLYVECLSGRDGAALWRTIQPLYNPQAEYGNYYLAEMKWLTPAGEDQPQLAVSAYCESGDATDRVCLFASSDGRLLRVANGVSTIESVDLNADHIDDWLLFTRGRNYWDRDGRLQGIRGVGKEIWRRAEGKMTPVADLNGDGVVDLVATEPQRHIRTRCGRTGELLWFRDLPRAYSSWQAKIFPAAERDPRFAMSVKHHDLDGDGIADFFYAVANDSYKINPWLVAISGKTGRVIWESEARAKRLRGFNWLDCRDLDGDGRAEVVIAAASDVVEGGKVVNDDWQLTLTVLEGATGKRQWSLPLVPPSLTTIPTPAFDYDRLQLEPAYGDLNGDKTLDLLLPGRPDLEATAPSMLAVSGRDGSVLWDRELPPDDNGQQTLSNVPPAAICDLNGDGKLEAVVLSMPPAMFGNNNRKGHNLEVQILDGVTGASRANWKTEVARWIHEVNSEWTRHPGRLRPVPVRLANGKSLVAVATNYLSWKLTLLDEAAQTVGSLPLQAASSPSTSSFLTSLDADGDGSDELLLYDNRGFQLCKPDRLQEPVWRRAIYGRIEGVLSNGDSGRLILSRSPNGTALLGVDPTTGATAWTTVGLGLPAVNQLTNSATATALLSPPGGDEPPRVFYQADEFSYVRYGNFIQAAATRDVQREPTPTLRPLAADPRLLHPLPWVAHTAAADPYSDLRIAGYLTFYGVTLIGVPGLYFYSLLRRRSWGLKRFFLLPVVAAVFLTGVLVEVPENDFATWDRKLFLSFIFAGPVMVALKILFDDLRNNGWRAIRNGVIVFAVCVVIVLGFTITIVSTDSQLLEGERYSWEGWQWLVILAAYQTAVFITTWSAFTFAIRAIIRRVSPAAATP